MPKPKKNSAATTDHGATVSYEAQLWAMPDARRGSMDAAKYQHVVLGLLFLKYISDGFAEQHARLVADKASGADPEDPDEYRALSIFWVPPEARSAQLKAQAKQPTNGNAGNANFAWVQQVVRQWAGTGTLAGRVRCGFGAA